MNPPKSYNQLCPLAMALDHIGDRWSMLIGRELLGGPARFSDLTRELPGIASNLLTERLRRLEASGVIVRRTTPGGTTYAMTDLGAALREPLEALGAWGMRAGPIEGSDLVTLRSARSAAMGLQAMLANADPPPVRQVLSLQFGGDEALVVTFGGEGPPVVRYGHPESADAVASTSIDALGDLPVSGPGNSIRHVDGNPAVTHEFVECLASGVSRLAG